MKQCNIIESTIYIYGLVIYTYNHNDTCYIVPTTYT